MLSQREKVDLLRNSSTYSHETNPEIDVIETNISWVFLTGKYVYKMKKEIQFGDILDFSTLEKREQACKNELKYNRRLAPDLYLDSVILTSDLKINGEGEPLEYLVKMQQLDQSALLQEKINRGQEITDEFLLKLAQTIVKFHKENIVIPQFSVYENIFEKWDENFRTTRNYPNFPFDEDLARRVYNYMENNKKYFENRGDERKIVDGHGDLILANIFESDGDAIIFDCIEFNEMLRIQDILEEIAFLAMDLDFQGMTDKSVLFLKEYLNEMEGALKPDSTIINFYKSYRAYVRAKVFFSQSLQEQSEEKRTKIVGLATKYMKLSSSYHF